jgi:sulfite reductase (NADPH) hemoprotein beta-component
VWVGGGLGRTPRLARLVHAALDPRDLLSYSEAILRVYNLYGRRDNLYKARIKILVDALGVTAFRTAVDAEWAHLRHGPLRLEEQDIASAARHFAAPDYDRAAALEHGFAARCAADPAFAAWARRNVHAHRVPGYRIVSIPLKSAGQAPGDMRAEQMEALAHLADRYSLGEVRTTHRQNLLLAHVRQGDLYALWRALAGLGLGVPNAGLITDLICCPGGDYCSLANATSIPLAQQLQARFAALGRQHDIGDIEIKISGCVNACGHHHVGQIGILGVERNGAEYYQLQVGGAVGNAAALGEVLGPALPKDTVADAVEALVGVYLERRTDGERFVDTCRRLGTAPFKERLYGN